MTEAMRHAYSMDLDKNKKNIAKKICNGITLHQYIKELG